MIRALCLSLALAGVAPQAFAAQVLLKNGSIMAAPAADVFMRQGGGSEAVSCTANSPLAAGADLPDATTRAGIRAIDERVSERFVYQMDEADTWHSYARHILSSSRPFPWAGDCDDLAISAMAVALCAGADPSRVGLVLYSATELAPAHMTAVFIDDSGASWVFGNTMEAMHAFRMPPGASAVWASAAELQRRRPSWTEIG